MKKLTLATFSTLTLSLACTSVFAVDGTITVNGVVTDGTCILTEDYVTKDITVNLPLMSKSIFTPTNPASERKRITLYLANATFTAPCDLATNKAFRGIHLSTSDPNHLDTTDKTLLVNKAEGAGGASAKNPVFIQISTENYELVDLSASWGSQKKSFPRGSPGGTEMQVIYDVRYVSKTGIVDAQNVNAVVNYTLHYN